MFIVVVVIVPKDSRQHGNHGRNIICIYTGSRETNDDGMGKRQTKMMNDCCDIVRAVVRLSREKNTEVTERRKKGEEKSAKSENHNGSALDSCVRDFAELLRECNTFSGKAEFFLLVEHQQYIMSSQTTHACLLYFIQ